MQLSQRTSTVPACQQRAHQVQRVRCPVAKVQQPRASPVVKAMAEGQEDVLPRLGAAFGAACVAASLMLLGNPGPAVADLNRYEYEVEGEFDRGSARQYAESNIDGKEFKDQDLRRSNFTSASAKRANFQNANLQGAYFMKSVLFQADFTGANLSDTLMDRAVINEAILKNANLSRAVLTRSDLTGAVVDGADFTNALIDKTQQMALCKYADGVNPVTGVSTRKSLGCGSARRFRSAAPSNPDGPQVTQDEQEAFRRTLPSYRSDALP